MSRPSTFQFDDRTVQWRPFRGFEGLEYSLLNVDQKANQVDMLMRFAPGQQCVPHCHVGPTKTLVLEGEHHIFAPGEPTSVRPAGTFSMNDGDETHVEGGGPEGAIILLMMTAVDGTVYDILNEAQSEVVRKISLDDFQRGYEKQQAS
ncbi:MAG: cupin domain-containing protein [Gammaproteobacteria bacterium]|nr:cupin domain-containing protein [Gammaproteobacteria bacterium]